MNILDWDEIELEELFNYNSARFGNEDDDGHQYFISDHQLKLTVSVLPIREVVGITVCSAIDGSVLVDLAIIARSRLEKRVINGVACLYCHQCAVVPGILARSELSWYAYFDYANRQLPTVTMQLECDPRIGLRFLDMSHGSMPV